LYWIPGRDFDVVDMLADVLGAGIGYGLCHLLLLLPEAKSS
jgi:VanZ family protein